MRQPGYALVAARLAKNITLPIMCMMIATSAIDFHCLLEDCKLSRTLPEAALQIHLRQPGNGLVIAQLVDDIIHVYVKR